MPIFRKIAIIIILTLFLPLGTRAFSVGLVSDLHAGSKRCQKNDPNLLLYPKKAFAEMKKAVAAMRAQGADVIIADGDITDRGERKYYKKLKKIAGIFWVKGNHDDKNFSLLAANDYYQDFGAWRVIALNSSLLFPRSSGGLAQAQIDQLKLWEDTNKSIIIAMHHPIFLYHDYTGNYEPGYQNFRDALTPNVKMVVSGHWHTNWNLEKDGILFEGVPALTNGGYKMVNLPESD